MTKFVGRIIISPWFGLSDHHVCYTEDFVSKIKDFIVKEDVSIVSDVSTLFTSIPPTDAMSGVRECLEKDSTLK